MPEGIAVICDFAPDMVALQNLHAPICSKYRAAPAPRIPGPLRKRPKISGVSVASGFNKAGG